MGAQESTPGSEPCMPLAEAQKPSTPVGDGDGWVGDADQQWRAGLDHVSPSLQS